MYFIKPPLHSPQFAGAGREDGDDAEPEFGAAVRLEVPGLEGEGAREIRLAAPHSARAAGRRLSASRIACIR